MRFNLFPYIHLVNYKELAEISQAQNKDLMKTIESLRATLESQNRTICSLSGEIKQLRELLLARDKSAEKMVGKLNGLAKIALPVKTEKRKVGNEADKTPAPTPKERGNNGAKRKVYGNLEEVVEEVKPSHPEFKKEDAVFISYREVIRYKLIPPRLIKNIYICKKYSFNDYIYEGKAPISPFLNSNFDSSVLANLIQQRFVYGMPVERIVRFYNEIGIRAAKADGTRIIN